MAKGVVLQKDKDAVIPRSIIEAAVKTYPTTFGYSAVDQKAGSMFIEAGMAKSVDDIMEIMEQGKDLHMVLHFGEVTGKLNLEDCQPFVGLSGKDDSPLITFFIEGRFEEHHEDNGHTDEYNLAQTYLVPKILQLYEMYSMHEDPMAKFNAYIRSNVFAKEISSMIGERGSITFMTTSSDPISLQRGNEGTSEETEWGWISDKFNILDSEAATPEEKKEEPKKTNALADRFKNKGKPAEAPKPAAAGASNVFDSSEDRMSHVIVREVGGKKMCFPTEFISSDKNRLKAWYNMGWGTCPTGYHLAVGHADKAPGMPLADIKKESKIGVTVKSLTDLGPALASKNGGSGKDTQPKEVTADMAKPVAAGFQVMPAGMKETATTYLKTLDFKSKDIADPDTMQVVEQKAPDFYEQFPIITRENDYQVNPEKRLEICRKWPEMANLWIETLLYDREANKAKLGKMLTPAAQETKKEEVNPLKARFAKKT